MISRKETYVNQTDEELMESVSEGNSGAFSVLYERYHEPIFRYFYKMLWQDHSKAEDFMQELFTKIIHKPQLFNPKYKFKTWLYTIAYNMCKNEYRKQEQRKTSVGVEEKQQIINFSENTSETAVDRTYFNEQLKKELNTLSLAHKQVFILRFKQGFSIREIADLLEVSEGTIKSRIFYLLKKLSTNLKAYNYEI